MADLKTNWRPGEAGVTDAVNAGAAKVNDLAHLTASGRLSEDGLNATIADYQAPTIDLGDQSGSVDLSSYFGYVIDMTLTGSVTIPAAGRPTVPVGVSGVTVLRVQQDATGGRTFIVEGARTRGGMPPLIAAGAGEVSLLSLVKAGPDWWLIETVSGGSVPAGW